MPNQELDLTDYSGPLSKAFPKMVGVGLLLAGLAVAVTWYMKPVWEVEASLLMANKDRVSPTLEALIGPQEGNPLSILKGILRSRTSLERIAQQHQIDRKDLDEALAVETVNEANQLKISVKWKGQEKAIAILQSSIDVLESMRKEIGFSVATRQAKLLEQAIKQKTGELDVAEAKVKDYQKRMKSLIDPTDPGSVLDLMRQKTTLEQDLGALRLQIREARARASKVVGSSVELPSGLPNAVDWQKRLSKAEYDLRIAKIKEGDASPNVVRLRKELDITRSQLQREIQNYFTSVETNIDSEVAKLEAQRIVMEWRLQAVGEMAASAPTEGQELSRLLREVGTLTSVLANLRQQFELKQIEEVGDVSWSVLEKPHLTEDEPVNKKFVRNGFLGFLVGVMLVGVGQVLSQRRRSFAKGV